MSLIDNFGRKINYLRLSVTGRCNLRCSYCVPARKSARTAACAPLSDDDLIRVVRAAADAGVEKVRVTGGEPLVRPGIIDLLNRMNGITGLKNIVLTTNGILLGEMANQLRDAGVASLNISIDSLRPEIFFRITRGGELRRVLDGLDAAEKAGFPHVKLNVVVMRGVNDAEVADFAAMTLDRPYKVRFIEYMPLSGEKAETALTVPGRELLDRLSRAYSLEQVTRRELDGPAVYYRIAGAVGEIGFITPVSCHFCNDCNRIRVTSEGMLKSCLFHDGVIDLKPLLGQDSDLLLQDAIRRGVEMKPHRHSLNEAEAGYTPFAMSQVGG